MGKKTQFLVKNTIFTITFDRELGQAYFNAFFFYDEQNLQITEQYTETCKFFGLKLPLFGQKFIFWDSPGAAGEFVSIFECTVSPMILPLYVSRRFGKIWVTSLYLYTFPRIQDGVQNGRH